MNPIRNYADVEDIVTQNWPNRESMIRAEGADPARFKRLLGLVVCHPYSHLLGRDGALPDFHSGPTANREGVQEPWTSKKIGTRAPMAVKKTT
jgi:hypothetical protein